LAEDLGLIRSAAQTLSPNASRFEKFDHRTEQTNHTAEGLVTIAAGAAGAGFGVVAINCAAHGNIEGAAYCAGVALFALAGSYFGWLTARGTRQKREEFAEWVNRNSTAS
jgi:hypothetical protein